MLYIDQRREYVLRRLRAAPEIFRQLPPVIEYMSSGWADEVETAISRMEALPYLLSKNISDLDLVVFLRGAVPGQYWAEIVRLKMAADFVPLMRLIEAAGHKPTLNKALSIIRAELPRIERDLTTIAAATIFYDRELIADLVCPDDEFFLRGMLYGEACNSLYFDEASIRRVIDWFAD